MVTRDRATELTWRGQCRGLFRMRGGFEREVQHRDQLETTPRHF